MPTVYIKADTKQASRNIKDLDNDVDKFARSSSQSLARMEKSFRTLKTLGIGLGGFFSAQVLAGYTKELIAVSDTYTNIKSRLDLVTDSTEDFTAAYDGLYQLSRETGTTLESNTQAFVAMSNAMQDATDSEIIAWLNTLDQGLVVSGSGAEEAANFMRQFNQAMAGGIVRAEEFNSMMENNPYIMNKVAAALGKTVGELRAMMLEGELTAEVFTGALSKISDVVEDDFGNMALTVERAWNDLRQVWQRIISDSDEAGGGTNALAEAIADLAQTAEENRDEISEFLAGFVKKIPGAIEGAGNIASEITAIGTAANDVVDGLDTKLGVGWKELGLIGLIVYGAKKIPKIGGPLAIFGVVETLASALADKIKEANPEVENTNLIVTKLLDTILGGSDKIKDIDFALEGEFLDIDTFQNQLDAIDMMLDQQFAEIDTAAAEQAGEKLGAAVSEGMSKEAKKAAEKLAKDMNKSLEGISGDIFDLKLEGETDQGQWDTLKQAAADYEEAAKTAAAAGDWEEARKNVESMINMLNRMPDSVEGAAPTDAQVARQKQLVQHYKDMASYHTSRHATNQYLEKAYQAEKKLVQMQKEQKEGASEIIGEEEARLVKLEELQEAQQLLLDIKKESSQVDAGGKTEAVIDTTQVEAAKTQLTEAKTATEEVNTAMEDMGTELVNVGGVWQNLTQDVIADLQKQQQAINSNTQSVQNYIQFLKQASGEINNTSYRYSTGDETSIGFATGGPVLPHIAPTVLPSPRYASGGVVPPQANITYANTPRFATGGGVIPGHGGTDSVTAKVTPGEGVVTPLGMNVLTRQGLSQLNVGRNPFEGRSSEEVFLDFAFNGQSAGGLSGNRGSVDTIVENFAKFRRSMS